MRWLWKALVFGLASPFVAGSTLAAGRADDAAGARTGESIIHDYRTADPVLPAYLATYDPYLCPQSGIVAFSAVAGGHVSEGGDTLLIYSRVTTNEGAGWPNGGGTFVAPCAGLYFFTVSFVKDAFYYGGTNDDVYVSIIHNGSNKGSAWAGEQVDIERATGSYSVALMLEQGDYIQTFTSSDSGRKRHLARVDFTGYLVRQRY